MTAAQLAGLLGQTRLYRCVEGMRVAVVVRDARSNFGRVDCLVEPVAGDGRAWVRLESLDAAL